MIVVGLMSGTSCDGVDVAVAELKHDDVAVWLTPRGHLTLPYAGELRAELLSTLVAQGGHGSPPPEGPVTTRAVVALDTRIGQRFADAAVAGLRRFNAGRGDLVISHGQTLHHWVEQTRVEGTLQVGQPAWIAEATGLPVISDVRARDVAAGGQGAPLASTLDVMLLTGRSGTNAALNIGGIANLTVVPEHEEPVAFDTGPGNVLLDMVAGRLDTRRPYDADGRLAAAGTIDQPLLAELLADPYYALDAPKSTGREHFTAAYLDEALARHRVEQVDQLATLTELTARTITDACRHHGVTAVVASGGGVHNATLIDRLRHQLGTVALSTSDELGLPADAKEAYLMALLGYLTWHGIPGTVPACTGARAATVLGSITPGTQPLHLPPPSAARPVRLRVPG